MEVPWDTDLEVEICLQEGQRGSSQQQALEGSEGSRTAYEEKSSCEEAATKASANPTKSSGAGVAFQSWLKSKREDWVFVQAHVLDVSGTWERA